MSYRERHEQFLKEKREFEELMNELPETIKEFREKINALTKRVEKLEAKPKPNKKK